MSYIWLILSVFCFIYYIMCVNYAGFGSEFVFMWLLAALFFGLVFLALRIIKTHEISIATPVRVVVCTIVVAAFIFFAALEGLVISKMRGTPQPNCNYMIVLGAQIRGTRVTKSLKRRLEAAYTYAIENQNTQIIVSGGQGEGEDITEAQAMKAYLVDRGIPENRIWLEENSTNTYLNMKYSAEYIQDKSVLVGIVSSDFHLYRALRLAGARGFCNTTAISAKTDNILFLNYMVREAVGIMKDFFVGNF